MGVLQPCSISPSPGQPCRVPARWSCWWARARSPRGLWAAGRRGDRRRDRPGAGGGRVQGRQGQDLHHPGARRRPVARGRRSAWARPPDLDAAGAARKPAARAVVAGRARRGGRDRRRTLQPAQAARGGAGRHAARLSVRPLPHQGEAGGQAALAKLTVLHRRSRAAAKSAWEPLAGIAKGVFLTRDLVSEPPNVLNPAEMAERCQKLTRTRPEGGGARPEGDDEARVSARCSASRRAASTSRAWW